MLIGYARVSSTGQSLEIQQEALGAAGVEKVFAEKRSGRTAADREQLQAALDYCRDGDVLIVSRLDRLARSVGDLHAIVQRLAAKGAGLRVLHQAGIDTTTPSGRLMLSMLGAIAEFENDLRRERQAEGIAKAKAAGVYTGRKATIDRKAIATLKAEGLGATEIARRLGVGRASVYRVLEAGAAST
jgi:DNA invertase Pin-like site-specific DNA recombinase